MKESNRKPNKIWVDKGSKFYNRSMKSWLEKNAAELYSTCNEGKSIVVERPLGNLKNKIHMYITLISNVNIYKLDDIVNKHSNTFQNTIKIKPADVKSSTNINCSKEINDENSKSKNGDFVGISKYKRHFCKSLCSKLV